MGQSHVKRRHRLHKPLKVLRAVASRELENVCEASGHTPDDHEHDLLVAEAVSLADPWAIAGVDAVLPADRLDLMRAWYVLRLSGVVVTEEEKLRAARSLAPCPGPVRDYSDALAADVAAAYASQHRRKRQHAAVKQGVAAARS